MAMWVMAVVGAAPCQCFSPGGNQITSPGRISSTGPPQRSTRPQPPITISVCPSGWVCHAVRAPGSNVTIAPVTRAGSVPLNGESMRTVPVNQAAGPLLEGCEPLLLMSIFLTPLVNFESERRELKLGPSAGTLINIPLQRGECACGEESNRFSGFQQRARPFGELKTARAVEIRSVRAASRNVFFHFVISL